MLVALIVLGSVGSAAVVAIRGRQVGVPGSAPSAQAIFAMPYTKVRSAAFREVGHAGGSTWTGSGVIEFAPPHAFTETLSSRGQVFERQVEAAGVAYTENIPSRFHATDYELTDFRSLGWDGAPAPARLDITAQTTLAGQEAWVLKQAGTANRWVVGEQTGDPLEAVVGGNETYTFSDWGRAPAIEAPAAGEVSTDRYAGSASAPAMAPVATVTVLNEQPDAAAGTGGDPPGFRTVALEISYTNTGSASQFDDAFSLVSSDGVFAPAAYATASPSLEPMPVAHGQTITGWDGFMVPRHATTFHLLFGEQLDQILSVDYLISISVAIPG